MTPSDFLYFFQITWQEALWGAFWAGLIVSLCTLFNAYTVWHWSRRSFIKNKLPYLHEAKVYNLELDNKELKDENKLLKKENQDLKDRLAVINSALNN
jgi:hypothetical protein